MKARNFFTKLAQIMLALALGALAVLAMPPYHFMLALIISVSGFFLLYNYSNSRAFTFLLSTAFFYGYFQAGLFWWAAPYLKPGQDISLYIVVAISLAPTVFALQHGLALTLAKMIPIKKAGQIFIFASAWALCTWFCSAIAPRVPANPLGYVWDFSLPSLQILSYIGIYGLTFLTILIACVPAIFFLRNSKLAIGLIGLAVLTYIGSILRLHDDPTRFAPDLQIRLVQTVISYEEKAKSLKELLDKMIPLTTQKGYDKINYVFWPEDVIDSFLIEGRDKTNYMLERIFDSVPKDGAIIFGSGRGKFKSGLPINAPFTGKDLQEMYNSLCIVDSDSKKLLDDCYDKSELIPFAEYNPLKDIVKLPTALDFSHERSADETLDYKKGPGKRTMKIGNLPLVSMLICYEVFFSREVINPNQPRPEWLLTVANDYYFRSTIGIATHLANARYRAIEEGLPMVFVANAGTSAVIDAYGRVIKQLPAMSEGIIDSSLPTAIKPTFYAQYGQTGFILLILIGLIIAIKISK